MMRFYRSKKRPSRPPVAAAAAGVVTERLEERRLLSGGLPGSALPYLYMVPVFESVRGHAHREARRDAPRGSAHQAPGHAKPQGPVATGGTVRSAAPVVAAQTEAERPSITG